MSDIIVVIASNEPEGSRVRELVKLGGCVLARAFKEGNDSGSVEDVDVCVDVDVSVDLSGYRFIWFAFKAPYLRSKDKMVNTIDELKEELGIV